ncbi:MAG: tRNA guanosine(34) transglycosylase Tgt [Elusimicrobia bacterium]|nr:tRNA guanosine(34) transglycosylase Tgt [Elusimicrobiota bacterium]
MFRIHAQDPKSKARAGALETRHGLVETPAFFPVATQASVKALDTSDLEELEVQGLLANAYHLYLKPGAQVLTQAGGLHAWMDWQGPILTDSGGFQVWSLAHLCRVREEGVLFRSHHDGSLVFWSPEQVIDFQHQMGSDILTPLDVCLPYPSPTEKLREASQRTERWARISFQRHQRLCSGTGDRRPLLFAILQGGTHKALRRSQIEALLEMGWDGYALGGLSVGEPKALTWEVLGLTSDLLPSCAPRYLMGMGTPEDILKSVEQGMDIFDCVWPTRNARNGQVLTSGGRIYIKNASYRRDFAPLEEGCRCLTCRRYSRAYLHHLYRVREISAARLLSLHNVAFLVRWMRLIRKSILTGTFSDLKKDGGLKCPQPLPPSPLLG